MGLQKTVLILVEEEKNICLASANRSARMSVVQGRDMMEQRGKKHICICRYLHIYIHNYFGSNSLVLKSDAFARLWFAKFKESIVLDQ